MEFSEFHFAQSNWFWGILLIPIIWVLYARFYHTDLAVKKLESFIDQHLIPHLLKTPKTGRISLVKSIILGSVLWTCLMAAMAGPRWSFREFENFSQDKALVILLDMSKSMAATDIIPSRLHRAKEEIDDLIRMNTDIKVGLVGFAADSHIISPITDDMNSIRHLLPFIDSDLVVVQGTNLFAALKTAQQMLENVDGTEKSVLVISDGGFEIDNVQTIAKDMARKGIAIYTLGIATTEGAEFIDDDGPVQRNGKHLISLLEKDKLQQLSAISGGKYFDTDYSDKNTIAILSALDSRSFLIAKDNAQRSNKQWDEKFHIFVFPVILVSLLWFRKGFTMPMILLILLTASTSIQAKGLNLGDKLFLNKEQQAEKALKQIEDCDTAAKLFDDPYKRGVAEYKAGNFAAAEKSFQQNQRPETAISALYNLGNTLVNQNKLEEAITTYKKVLEQDPRHEKAKYNMEVLNIMLCKQADKEKKEQNNNEKSQGSENNNPDSKGDDDQDKQSNDEDKDKHDKQNNENDQAQNDESDQENDQGKNDKPDKNTNTNDNSNDNDDQDNKNDTPKSDDSKTNNQDNNQNDLSKETNDQDLDKNDTAASSTDFDNNENSGQEINVDQWLNSISSDPKNFLKNQFYIESLKNKTKPSKDPW